MSGVILAVLVILEFSAVFFQINLIGKPLETVSLRTAKVTAVTIGFLITALSVACSDLSHNDVCVYVQTGIAAFWIFQAGRVLLYAGIPVQGRFTAAKASRRVAVSMAMIAGLLYLFTRAV
jgi:hypothetical protein